MGKEIKSTETKNLSALIEGLTILLKYNNPKYPTHCEHDILTVCVNPSLVDKKDIVRLDELGFDADYEEECFASFRFGSC